MRKIPFPYITLVEIGSKNQSKTIIWCEKLIWIPGEWGNSKMNILFWDSERYTENIFFVNLEQYFLYQLTMV